MGVGSVDLIPPGAELPAGRKSRGVSCRLVLLGPALPVWDRSVTAQVLQQSRGAGLGLPGHCRAHQGHLCGLAVTRSRVCSCGFPV